jgi:formylglycine-generating enzyme required for sulfatase activity
MIETNQTLHLNSSARGEFIEPTMVRIPESWFLMGSESGQDNERPVHRVCVDAFELAACQVTNAEYEKFLRATGHRAPLHWGDANFSHPEQPVVAPSWFDAVAYCEWLSRMTQRRYRLPTEAEWERAARGGAEQKLFPWGDAPLGSLQNYATRWRTAPELVGHAEKNPYGLFDIGANVHEWCADWFDPEYYRISPERNPEGAPQGTRRASRGGSWRHHTKVSRCAARSSIPPEFQYADYGFRIARDISA